MEEVGGLCEIQRKKSRGGGTTKYHKARERAAGREEDTGIFYYFFPLQNLVSQNPPDKFSSFTQKEKKNPKTMRDKWQN